MPFTPIAFFGAILVFIVVFAIWATRKTRENLTQFARDLGLQLHEIAPVLGLFRSPPTVHGERGGRRIRFFQFSTGAGKRR